MSQKGFSLHWKLISLTCYGDLNKLGIPAVLGHLRNWFPVGNTVGLGLGAMTVPEGVCHTVVFEVKSHALFSVCSVCFLLAIGGVSPRF